MIAILVVLQHFLFDWLLQPRWIAISKASDILSLGLHGIIITIGFFCVARMTCPLLEAILLSLIYGLSHVIQDRIIWGGYKPRTDNPYQEKAFWDTIAIDQALHLTVALLLLRPW